MKIHERAVGDVARHLRELIGTLSAAVDRDLTRTSLSHKRKQLAHVT